MPLLLQGLGPAGWVVPVLLQALGASRQGCTNALAGKRIYHCCSRDLRDIEVSRLLQGSRASRPGCTSAVTEIRNQWRGV